MATYNDEQVSRYLDYIGFDAAAFGEPSVEHLQSLTLKTLSAVPFESLSLHYSNTHQLSLDPDDIYNKIVGHGRGGYCMEINMFFGIMLRSLGYTLIHAGARVSYATGGRADGGFMGLNHMVNLVTIGDQRYVVDVGFGGDNPCRPIPLRSGVVVAGIGLQTLRLDLKTLAQHTDKTQKVWVYSHRDRDEAEWQEGYCFTETEFFPADFGVMNLATMTLRQSFFVQTVLCVRVLLDERGEPEGTQILMNENVTRKVRGETEREEPLRTEQQRVDALKRLFGITLSREQQEGIRGLPSELKGQQPLGSK